MMAADAPAGAAGPRILVVDDTEDLRVLLARVLQRLGARTEIAVHGRDALDRVAEAEAAGRPFDAVLLDMQMPVLDGYAAARALRARGSTLLVVAMTAHSSGEEIARCREAGCDRHLAKPFNPDLLPLLIEELRARTPPSRG
jgi:CheY-like chemotaxis protein